MALFPNATDRLFLRFCRTGDTQALGRVFDRTAPELLRVACYLCGDRSDAEDLVQRTFLAAIEARAAYDPRRRAVPWLLGILANHRKRLQRERQRPAAAPVVEPAADPAQLAAQGELAAALARLRDELGEPYGEVLRLHLDLGLNAKEIAAQLARPSGTVRTQLVRALELLRQRLPDGFVAALVPWSQPAVDTAAHLGLAAIRSRVLQGASHLATEPTTATVAAAATLTLSGSYLMSKKVLFLVPVLLTAIGVTTYLAMGGQPDLPQAPERPASAAGPVSLQSAPTPAAIAAPTVAAERTEGSGAPAQVTPHDAGFAVVEVLVRWAGDGAPAANVGVFASNGRSVQGRSAVTDASGSCELLHLAPGTWQVSSSLTETGMKINLVADERRRIELRAERAGLAQGRVVDDQDRPVEAARIWMSLEGDWSSGHEVARSDAAGNFAVPLRTAHYLGARKDGYAPSHTLVANAGDENTLRPVLRLQHLGGTVRGTVRDAHGAPIAWAKVLVGEEIMHFQNAVGAAAREHLPRGIEVVTDRDGSFVAPGVPAGLCEVRAWAPGFAPFVGGTEVPARGIAELPITLVQGAAVRGTVRNEQGAPLAGASLRWGNEYGFAHGTAQSASNGTFALEDLPPGWHELHAALAGATATTRVQIVAATDATWNPVLGTNRPIAGRVLGPRGEALVGYQVSAWRDDTEKATTTTDDQGRFTLAEVGASAVALEVSQRFQSLHWQRDVPPGSADVVVQLPAAALPTAQLRGRLVDADGRPVAATIVPWREGANRALHYQSDPATGVFTVGPVPPGRYSLSFESPNHGRQPASKLELQPDESRDLGDIVLATPGGAEFLVTIDGRRAPGGLVFCRHTDGTWSDTLTIENGVAKAPALRPGQHRVSVDFQGLYAACELLVEAGVTAHASLELQRTGRVEVVLDLPSRSKAAQLDATLVVCRGDGSWAGEFGIARMDGPPTFLVDLAPGHYRATITTADGRTAPIADLEAPAPQQTRQLRIALPPAGK